MSACYVQILQCADGTLGGDEGRGGSACGPAFAYAPWWGVAWS